MIHLIGLVLAVLFLVVFGGMMLYVWLSNR